MTFPSAIGAYPPRAAAPYPAQAFQQQQTAATSAAAPAPAPLRPSIPVPSGGADDGSAAAAAANTAAAAAAAQASAEPAVIMVFENEVDSMEELRARKYEVSASNISSLSSSIAARLSSLTSILGRS